MVVCGLRWMAGVNDLALFFYKDEGAGVSG